MEVYQKGCSKLVCVVNTNAVYHEHDDHQKIFSSLFNAVGVSFTKWAIEYEEPAGEAFSKNHHILHHSRSGHSESRGVAS